MARSIFAVPGAALTGLLLAATVACSGADEDPAGHRTPGPTTTTSSEAACGGETSPAPSRSTATEDSPKVTSVELDSVPLLDPGSWADLPDGRPPALPWWEYEGNPEQYSDTVLHVGKHALQVPGKDRYRYVATWRKGVVLEAENQEALVLHRFDGSRQKLAPLNIPEQSVVAGDRIAWAEMSPDSSGTDWFQLSPQEPRKTGIDLPSALALPSSALLDSARAVGFLADDLVFEVRYLCAGTRVLEYRTASGTQVEWPPAGDEEVSVPARPSIGKVTARDSDGRLLWSRRFTDRGRPAEVVADVLSAQAVRVFVSGHSVLLEARTGRPLFRIAAGQFYELEDASHLLIASYDGPPNPLFDPQDDSPSPSELEWHNRLVRCSLARDCERAVRVEAPARSLSLAKTGSYW